MTLREFMIDQGLARPGASKALCPFHGDSDPSAMLNDDTNTLWCFGCHRMYTPEDFHRKYGVVIDEIKAAPRAGEDHSFGEVLFYA
jgi:nickel-dependent lactate racemase